MEAQDIIDVIRRRRDAYWERQVVISDDPDALAEEQYAKRVTEEYDSLLEEIKRIQKTEETKQIQETQLVQLISQQKAESDE
jgi:hypothetical protein